MAADYAGKPEQTITTLSQYRQFGSTTLPTEAVIHQRGKEVFRIILVSADFDTPVAAEHSVIPDADSTEQFVLPK